MLIAIQIQRKSLDAQQIPAAKSNSKTDQKQHPETANGHINLMTSLDSELYELINDSTRGTERDT